MGVEDSIHAEVLQLEKAFPDADVRVVVLDWREGVESEQAMTAYVAEDLGALSLSGDIIKRRDQWIPALPGIERGRLELRMRKAATSTARDRIQRGGESRKARPDKSVLDAVEAEKQVTKSSSSSSIHDPAPSRETISRGQRFNEEDTTGWLPLNEQLQKEVHGGKRRILVMAEMGSGNARHISGAALPVRQQEFSQCLNGERFGFIDCPRCNAI